MQNNRFISKKLFGAFAILLAFVMLLSGCGLGTAAQKLKIGERATVLAEYTAREYHVPDAANQIYVAKSGLIELYFDSTTYSVSVCDTNTGTVWASLPDAAQEDTTAASAVLTVQVSDGKTLYTLNAQDNAVAFGSALFRPTENGIQLTFDMALNSETANSTFEAVPAGELYVSVTVVYTLEDGAMRAKVNCGEMLVSQGYTVESIALMDWFGARAQAAEGDYIFVPDGCGAIEEIATAAAQDVPVRTFLTYGADAALAQSTETADGTVVAANALIPAYGMKCGESAFLALIENGDAISSVQEYRRSSTQAYDRVGAAFRITDVLLTGEAGEQTWYAGNSYNGTIGICYRFLSNKNAGYSGMAAACRELLIRNGVLSTKTVAESEYLPFVLTVDAAAANRNPNNGGLLTDYSQMQELLSLMKAKSINNIFLRYNGLLEGASSQQLLEDSDLLDKLGNKKELEALTNYVTTQQFTLYLNLNILSFGRRSVSPWSYAATDLSGKSISFTEENPFVGFAGEETHKRYLLRLSRVEENVTDFIADIRAYNFGGYCIDDAGSMLYTDYHADVVSRTSATNLLQAQASTISAGHKLMVDTGNMYMLKNADVVSNLPGAASYAQTETYSAVPFVQMVLHGVVEYAQAPANLSENSEQAFLKSLEYGALPSYTWTFSKTDVEAIDAVYNYENQITTASEQYATANSVLHDLRAARMTAHEKVQDGVYRTEYNNSIVLYFNYTDAPVTVNSITVQPMSCLRVN